MLDTCLHQHNSHAIDKVMFCLRFKKEHFYIILVVISHGVLSKKYRKGKFSDLSFLLLQTHLIGVNISIVRH